jgi:hypothetical protein
VKVLENRVLERTSGLTRRKEQEIAKNCITRIFIITKVISVTNSRKIK